MFEQFATRSYELERLDTGDYTLTEYRRWRREMWVIHRIFGELRALRRTLFRDIETTGDISISVLDVGAGSGELLQELAKWTKGRETFFVGAEINDEAARSIKSATLAAIQCDALRLPFAGDSFDYVFCTLFLHHLNDDGAVSLLQEMARVARKRIYVIDLNRSLVAYYSYKILGKLILQRFSLEDGSLSILRSFDRGELYGIAAAAGLRDVKIERSMVNRLILSGRKGS